MMRWQNGTIYLTSNGSGTFAHLIRSDRLLKCLNLSELEGFSVMGLCQSMQPLKSKNCMKSAHALLKFSSTLKKTK